MFKKKYLLLIALAIFSALVVGACTSTPEPTPIVEQTPSTEEIEYEAKKAEIEAALPTEPSNCLKGMVLIDVNSGGEDFQSKCTITEGDLWKLTLLAGSTSGAPGSHIALLDKRGNLITQVIYSDISFVDYSVSHTGLDGKTVSVVMSATSLWNYHIIDEITIPNGYQPADMTCLLSSKDSHSIQGNYDFSYPFGSSLVTKRGPLEKYSFISPITDGENVWLTAFYEGNEIYLDELVPLPNYGETVKLSGTYVNNHTGENISVMVPVTNCGGGIYATDIVQQ